MKVPTLPLRPPAALKITALTHRACGLCCAWCRHDAAILYLSGFKQRFFYGKSYTAKENWNFSDLTYRVQSVIKREKEVIMNQITRNHVTHVRGRGSFWDANTILVRSALPSQLRPV